MLRLLTLPRLLLILEWILLGIAVFLTGIVWILDILPQSPVLTVVCIGVIVLLGLKPLKGFHPLGYTLVEFGLIGLPGLVSKSSDPAGTQSHCP